MLVINSEKGVVYKSVYSKCFLVLYDNVLANIFNLHTTKIKILKKPNPKLGMYFFPKIREDAEYLKSLI